MYGREVMVDEKGKVVQMIKSPNWRLKRAGRLAEAAVLSFLSIAVGACFWFTVQMHVL